MLSLARSGARRRWVLVAVGLGMAGLIMVTAVVASRSKAASLAPSTVIRSSATLTDAPTPSVSVSSSVMLPGGRPDSTLVGGQTGHLVFARLVAQTLLAYDPSTDFNARNQDLSLASAPVPYADSARLAQDLAAFTPTGPALTRCGRTGRR